MKLDDAALIEELRKHSPEAARRYLEHVVVSKKSPNKKLHHELLENLFLEAEEQLGNDGVRYHLEELGRHLWRVHLAAPTDKQTLNTAYDRMHSRIAFSWRKSHQRHQSSRSA